MRWAWVLAVVLIVTGLFPVAMMLAARAIAQMQGCVINEAFPQPCMFWGADHGGTLSWLFASGWLFFLTAPAALAGFALAIGLALANLVRRARR